MSRIALAILVFAFSGVAWAQTAAPEPPVVITRGQALVKKAPDQAWVAIAAETRASGPADAQRQAADAMTAVQAALAKSGVPADAIKTISYSLQPDLEWTGGRSRVRGYIVRNQIEVRVDSLDKLGGVLDAAGASGAASMSGLRYDLKDRATVEREALRLAVQDAMARARAIAAGAGVSLGAILRIDEQSERPGPIPHMMSVRTAEAGAPAQTPISPGEVEIHVQVTLTVGIK